MSPRRLIPPWPLAAALATLALLACSGDAGSGPEETPDTTIGVDTSTPDGDTTAADATEGDTHERTRGPDTAVASDAPMADTTDVAAMADVADTADVADLDSASPDVAEVDTSPPGPEPVRRVVIAGDSWSTGSVNPTKAVFAARGHGEVDVTWDGTVIAGSRASEWVVNHEGKLEALVANLDADPPAEVLLLYLGGNDFNFTMASQGWSSSKRDAAIAKVEADLAALVDFVLTGRPHLTVVLVDYTYFNYPKMRLLYGFDIAPNLAAFNEAYVEMGRRKRGIAAARARCEYAHNFGVLQHTYGDTQRIYPFEPWVVPAYDAGHFPAPGGAPAYDPFPGGEVVFPAPDPVHFDGLHPEDWAFETIIENVLVQGLSHLLAGHGWLGP